MKVHYRFAWNAGPRCGATQRHGRPPLQAAWHAAQVTCRRCLKALEAYHSGELAAVVGALAKLDGKPFETVWIATTTRDPDPKRAP